MALTPKSIGFITKWIQETDARQAAQKILDQILIKKCGLTSGDLPDTNTFGIGLDKIESYLSKGKFQEAYDSGIKTADKMLREEGAGLFESELRSRINKIIQEAYFFK